jgi:hypothetical protein
MIHFEIETDICIGLESMKSKDKQLETSAREDVVASIELIDKVFGIEKKKMMKNTLLNEILLQLKIWNLELEK